jgi:cell division protein FtsB
MSNSVGVSATSDLGAGTKYAASRAARCARRRRTLLLAILVLVVAAAALANYGPLRSYREARARLEKTAAEVAALETQRAELQAQLGRLTEAGYLESLAREELAYARPGEELYIVTGSTSRKSPSTTSPDRAGSVAEDGTSATGSSTASSLAADDQFSAAALAAASSANDGSPTGEQPAAAQPPGFLEKLLLGFLGLF